MLLPLLNPWCCSIVLRFLAANVLMSLMASVLLPLLDPAPPSCSHLLPALEQFLALCISCLEVPRLTESNMPSANNAIWSMGELIIRAPPASLLPHVVRICEAAATPLMGSVRVSRSLQENGAITLGRTAMVCPDQVCVCVWGGCYWNSRTCPGGQGVPGSIEASRGCRTSHHIKRRSHGLLVPVGGGFEGVIVGA
jgi:hypothetical protein